MMSSHIKRESQSLSHSRRPLHTPSKSFTLGQRQGCKDNTLQHLCLPSFPKRTSKYIQHFKHQLSIKHDDEQDKFWCQQTHSSIRNNRINKNVDRTQSAPDVISHYLSPKKIRPKNIVPTKEYTKDNRNLYYNTWKQPNTLSNRVVQLDDNELTDGDDVDITTDTNNLPKLPSSGLRGRKLTSPTSMKIGPASRTKTSPLSSSSSNISLNSFDRFPLGLQDSFSHYSVEGQNMNGELKSKMNPDTNKGKHHFDRNQNELIGLPADKSSVSYYTIEPAYEDVRAVLDSVDYNLRTEQLLQYYTSNDQCFMCQAVHDTPHKPISVYKRSLMSRDGIDRHLVTNSLMTSPRNVANIFPRQLNEKKTKRNSKVSHHKCSQTAADHSYNVVDDPLEVSQCFIKINQPAPISPRTLTGQTIHNSNNQEELANTSKTLDVPPDIKVQQFESREPVSSPVQIKPQSDRLTLSLVPGLVLDGKELTAPPCTPSSELDIIVCH